MNTFTSSAVIGSSDSNNSNNTQSLTKEQYNKFALQFLLLDTNNDDKLELSQLGTFLRSIGLHPSDEDVNGLITLMERKGSKEITLTEAMELAESMQSHKVSEEALREALRVLDEDGDGYMSTAELRHVLLNMGSRLNNKDVDEIISDLNITNDETNGTKLINLDDFITQMLPESSSTYEMASHGNIDIFLSNN